MVETTSYAALLCGYSMIVELAISAIAQTLASRSKTPVQGFVVCKPNNIRFHCCSCGVLLSLVAYFKHHGSYGGC